MIPFALARHDADGQQRVVDHIEHHNIKQPIQQQHVAHQQAAAYQQQHQKRSDRLSFLLCAALELCFERGNAKRQL